MFAQPQLKYDPQQQYHQFLSINPHMPPYVPNIQAPTPQVGPYMAMVAGKLAAKIQNAARENPLRMTVFNLAAENNYGNQYFDTMATMAIELTAYLMTQREPAEAAVEKATELVHDYYTAANVRVYNVLGQFIPDPNVRSAIQGTITNFDNTANMLQQFMQQLRSQGGGYQQAQSQHFNGGAQTQGYAANSYAAGQSGGGQASFSGGGGLFDPVPGSTNTAVAALPAATSGSGNFSQWNGPAEAIPIPAASGNVIDVDVANTTTVDAHTGNWKPNLLTEPYFYAYEPSKWNAKLLVQNDGTTIPDYIPKTESEKMDYNAHATNNVFGKVPDFLDVTQAAKTMERISAGVNQLNHEALDDEPEGNVTTVKTMIAEKWLFATSESDAWMRASLARLMVEPGENGLPHVYRTYARVAEAVVGNVDETQIIRDLVKCKSFLGLREKMTNLGSEMSTALYNAVNFRMTELVNRKVRQELGLRKVSIENFYDDIGDMVEYLKTKFGEVVKGGFLRNQEADIARNLQTLSKTVAELESDAILHGMAFPKDNKPAITFVASNYSLTYLDCMSWDLNVEMGFDIPVKLTQEVTPLFYQLVKGAFLDADKHETEDNKALAIARILMRTNDGRIFECSRGALADESYLITLLK